MNLIIVLTVNHAHAFHWKRWMYQNKNTKFIFPQEVNSLRGYKPIAIIEIDDWWKNKTEEFCNYISILKEEIEATHPSN